MSKYWFWSVGFLYKSVIIFPCFILQEVSRYGIDSLGVQGQEESCCSVIGVVCDIVNIIVGWMVLISVKNS